MNLGRINKNKGNNAEREFAKIFRDFGYSSCITSRQGNKFYDNIGIDLLNLPFYVQIKAGKQKNLNVSKTLYEINNNIKKNKIEEKPLVLIHKKAVGKGHKKNDYDSLVSLSMNDFLKILKNDKNNSRK